jgi:hypothetical protein
MSETLNIPLDDRDWLFVHEAAQKDEMRPEMVVRRWMRLGQMVDHFMRKDDLKLKFLNPTTGEIIDPFDSGPKKAPMPTCSACERSARREWTEPEEHTCGLEQWANEGGA